MAIEATSTGAQGLENVITSRDPRSTEQRVEQKQLGQEDFFKLLTTQLSSQDPLKPMEDTAFIAQMANFSQLEMTSQLTSSFEKFTSIQQFAAAQNYIGKTVSLSTGEVGQVTAVENKDDQTLLFFDGKNTDGRDVNTVYKVEAGNASSDGGSNAGGDDGASDDTTADG
ncbi:flagellar hook capping FlgD N-terminal domain-containing protein [Pelagicoccus sp. SDUM812003]|uniref:flagellar hook capping FlgD N-terminal domain-containing protein n=1 Tax=Pelagicoccus sp. SDUM812003 TaxID=3041267 RepID=UPI00280E42B6|nr:flagellar hook capping FlgD N-terminal domain-containing protein [Pelagicoccus sp. SDUM812003]MDQ8202537.1 flagellar hook capping FlgD N-terminal domain-containing protein [Pelagicoccus sp. SDUM812003]